MIDGQNGLIQPSTFFLLFPRQLELLAWYGQGHPLIQGLRTHIHLAGILTHDGDLCRNWRSPFSAYHQYLGVGRFNTWSSQAAKDVRASQDTLLDIFERIDMSFRRLEMYTEVPLTTEMTDMTIQIMAEVISILGIATKEIRHSPTSE